MAVTTFENFYTLVKNNIVYFQYQKGDIVFNIKGTLVRDLIPGSDNDLQRYDQAIKLSDLFLGSDSDKNMLVGILEKTETKLSIPTWLKIYSTNYENWINIEIGKILSLQVVDS